MSITGVQAGRGGYLGGTIGWPSCQRYGINAGTGADDKRVLTFIGNQAFGNQVAPFQIPTGGVGIVNIGNTGG